MALQSQRSQHSFQRPVMSSSHCGVDPNDERRLQNILDLKTALGLQQEELDKQYVQLDRVGKDLLSQRGSVSRSSRHNETGDRRRQYQRDRKLSQSRSIFTKDLRKRTRPPSRRDRENRDRRERKDNHSAESP